jgi:hypothetical protein
VKGERESKKTEKAQEYNSEENRGPAGGGAECSRGSGVGEKRKKRGDKESAQRTQRVGRRKRKKGATRKNAERGREGEQKVKVKERG